jgi:hypothetical protein
MSFCLNLRVSSGLRYRSDLVDNLFPYFHQTIYLTGHKCLQMHCAFCQTCNLYFTKENKSIFRKYGMMEER